MTTVKQKMVTWGPSSWKEIERRPMMMDEINARDSVEQFGSDSCRGRVENRKELHILPEPLFHSTNKSSSLKDHHQQHHRQPPMQHQEEEGSGGTGKGMTHQPSRRPSLDIMRRSPSPDSSSDDSDSPPRKRLKRNHRHFHRNLQQQQGDDGKELDESCKVKDAAGDDPRAQNLAAEAAEAVPQPNNNVATKSLSEKDQSAPLLTKDQHPCSSSSNEELELSKRVQVMEECLEFLVKECTPLQKIQEHDSLKQEEEYNAKGTENATLQLANVEQRVSRLEYWMKSIVLLLQMEMQQQEQAKTETPHQQQHTQTLKEGMPEKSPLLVASSAEAPKGKVAPHGPEKSPAASAEAPNSGIAAAPKADDETNISGRANQMSKPQAQTESLSNTTKAAKAKLAASAASAGSSKDVTPEIPLTQRLDKGQGKLGKDDKATASSKETHIAAAGNSKETNNTEEEEEADADQGESLGWAVIRICCDHELCRKCRTRAAKSEWAESLPGGKVGDDLWPMCDTCADEEFEVWHFLRCLPKKSRQPCRNEGCKKRARVVYYQSQDKDDHWPLCEGCEQKDFAHEAKLRSAVKDGGDNNEVAMKEPKAKAKARETASTQRRSGGGASKVQQSSKVKTPASAEVKGSSYPTTGKKQASPAESSSSSSSASADDLAQIPAPKHLTRDVSSSSSNQSKAKTTHSQTEIETHQRSLSTKQSNRDDLVPFSFDC